MLFLVAYIASVVLINYAFSTAPHLDIIWSAWGGLVFVLRDMVQTRFGHGAIAAMLAALVLSYVTSDPSIALASATAFGCSRGAGRIGFRSGGQYRVGQHGLQ